VNRQPSTPARRARVGSGILATLTGLAALAGASSLGGCGHGTAAAAEQESTVQDELAEFLRVLELDREERERIRESATAPAPSETATLALTVERPLDFASGYDEAPADRSPLARLTAEEVLLSFAMYGEAGRWLDQWPLLTDATRRAWLERVRREARRVGLAEVEDRIAAADARRMWAEGFAAGAGRTDLDVRWRTQVSGDLAVIQVIRDETTLGEITLVRESGAWRLELAAELERAGVGSGPVAASTPSD
jgi:hypothetical protein